MTYPPMTPTMTSRLMRDMARFFGRRDDRVSRFIASDLVRQAETYEAMHGLTPEDIQAAEAASAPPEA